VTPVDHPTDAQLVAQVLTGNQAAYRLLVERHQRAVYNAAYRLLGEPEEATDLLLGAPPCHRRPTLADLS
jgi:hypothetical protein